MAFLPPYENLPNDNDVCLIIPMNYPGLLLEAQFNSSEQLFILTISGLTVPAYMVLEWELVII